MIKYTETQVVFSEIPDEITLCINISNCPFRCPGCHSPYLQEDVGMELNYGILQELIENNKGITCVCFMGGDSGVGNLISFAESLKKDYPNLKVGWYSGLSLFRVAPSDLCLFDYIKLGNYIESLGPLNNPNTNQRMYEIAPIAGGVTIKDITYKFWKNG